MKPHPHPEVRFRQEELPLRPDLEALPLAEDPDTAIAQLFIRGSTSTPLMDRIPVIRDIKALVKQLLDGPHYKQ